MSDIFDELGRFDGEYRPETGIRPGIDTLPDGDYEFEILSADVGRTQKSMDALLRLGLQVAAGGVVERAYFLTSQDAVNRLGADLCAMGFSEFAKPASFAKALQGALPKLKGVRFRARKKAEMGKDQKVYHNLYIAGRLNGARTAPPAPAAVTGGGEPPAADKVPF